MTTPKRLPAEVLAAITAAIALELGTTPDRLRLRLVSGTPPEQADTGWRLAARLGAMRLTRWQRG